MSESNILCHRDLLVEAACCWIDCLGMICYFQRIHLEDKYQKVNHLCDILRPHEHGHELQIKYR